MPVVHPARGGHRRLRLADLAGIERGTAYLAAFLAAVPTLRVPGVFFTASDLLFCLSLFLLLIGGGFPRQPLGRAMPLWYLGFALLMGGLLLGSLAHGDPGRAGLVIAQYLFAYVLLLFSVLRRNEAEAYRIAGCFIAGLILFVDLHGIVVFYALGYRPGSMIVSGARRLVTILGDANLAAAVNALTLPSMLHLWLHGSIPSLLAVPMLAIVAVTVVLTGSFGGFLAVCLSLLVFLGSIMSRRLFLRILLLAAAGAVALHVGGAAMLPDAFRNRVLGALSTGDLSQAGTLEDRAALIYEALGMIAQRGILLIGLGADQFRLLSVQGAPVHNMYVLLWVEGGVLALIGWLLFLLVGLLLGFASRRLGAGRYTAATTTATIAVFAFVANTNPHMYARFWLMPLLLTLGLLMAELRQAGLRSGGWLGKGAAVIMLLGLLGAPAAHAVSPSVETVQLAMRQAAGFMRERTIAQGGYGWRYSADLAERRGEGLMTPTQGWVQPPGIPAVGTAYLQAFEATQDPYYLDAAREAAAMLLRSQLRSGGWWYMAEFDPAAREQWCYRTEPPCRGNPASRGNEHRNTSELDDNTTQGALVFLIRLDRLLDQPDPALREAIDYGLGKLTEAQYANGAWPVLLDRRSEEESRPGLQASLPEQWSRTHVALGSRLFYTTNDFLMRDMIRLFLLAHRVYGQAGYLETARRAGNFLLDAQLPEPQPGWAQHYNQAMQPVWGRRFEPPAVASRETAGSIDALVDLHLYTGETRWLDRAAPAAAWLERVRLPDGDWPRFYELGSNTPLYMTSTYELTYAANDTPTHYGFKTQLGIPAALERYRRVMAASEPKAYLEALRSPNAIEAGDAARLAVVAEGVATLGPDGSWVEGRRIYSETFVNRLKAMAEHLMAGRRQPLVTGNLELELAGGE